MNNLSGGYIMVDLASPNKVKQLEKAAALNKPLLVYYADGTTEWGKVSVTYETVDDVDIPTYHITTANGFVTVEVDGDVSARPLIVEGDLEFEEITGVTFTYGKWSLCGTHLMVVLAGTVANGTSITFGTYYAAAKLPKFAFDKIHPISGALVSFQTVQYLSANPITTQSANIDFVKDTETMKLRSAAITLTADRMFRVQFDLLIDNE